MEQSINIRKIINADFEFIYQSMCALENEELNIKFFENIFNENIANPNYLYLIAECDTEKIGFITFHCQNLLHHVGLVGEIQEFYIIPVYRGKGVGRKLVNEIMHFAKKNNLKSIEVATNKKRLENIAVYENLGFNLTHNKFTIYK